MLILCLFNDVELSCRGNAAKDLSKEVEIKRGQTDFDGALTSFCPIPCFGSLAQPKIPTPVAIQILV